MKRDSLAIFILEDEPSILRALKRIVQSAGYRHVETYDSAEAFLKHAVVNGPSMLISDLLLPGMNGIDLHLHLRDSGRPLRTVFISASEPELARAREKVRCADGLAFLRKPFEVEDLLAAVRAAHDTDC